LSELTEIDHPEGDIYEWEYAARAGTETAYWWGNEAGQNRANFFGSGSQWAGKQTAPVGSFDPNPWGLHDTVGNVWEWVRDIGTIDTGARRKTVRLGKQTHPLPASCVAARGATPIGMLASHTDTGSGQATVPAPSDSALSWTQPE
jgi:formylglycine-generating enzyme required for sulfatase activity